MTTETALRDVLQRAAATVEDDDAQIDQVVRRGRRRRHRTRAVTVAAVAVLAVTAAVAGTSFEPSDPAPYDTSAPTEHPDVVIYLCGATPASAAAEPACDTPVTAADISRLRAALAVDEAVAEARHETQQEAYERFAELFADQPGLVDSVSPDRFPEGFPSSLRVILVDGAEADEVVRHYRGFDGVADAVAVEGPEDDGIG